ncbi:MAG: nucleotide pyrophosphohydrolase [Epulopiscium sp.]|nr:nucleotide pyrophosphohydrolase [Candidatus Epulonipiscium sp.]
MDSKTTIEELKNLVKKFCQDREWDQYHNPKDLAIGISTEANELLDIFRFKSEDQMKTIMKTVDRRRHVEDELADTLFFILRFAQLNGIDLNNVLKRKLEVNNQKYPKELVRGSNKKYNE